MGSFKSRKVLWKAGKGHLAVMLTKSRNFLRGIYASACLRDSMAEHGTWHAVLRTKREKSKATISCFSVEKKGSKPESRLGWLKTILALGRFQIIRKKIKWVLLGSQESVTCIESSLFWVNNYSRHYSCLLILLKSKSWISLLMSRIFANFYSSPPPVTGKLPERSWCGRRRLGRHMCAHLHLGLYPLQ